MSQYGNIEQSYQQQPTPDHSLAKTAMKSINPIQDSEGYKYCIIDPSLCLQQAQQLSYDSLIQCKFCKSIHVPRIKAKQSQCLTCKCMTDVKDYCGIVPLVTSNIVSTTLPHLKLTVHPQMHKSTPKKLQSMQSSKIKSTNMRLLIIYQSKLEEQFSSALQCLRQILPEYPTLQLCLIMYDTQIRLVQLQQDGRIIIMNEQSLQLINDKFYAFSEQSISQCLSVIESEIWHKAQTTLNCTKVIIQILQHIKHVNTAVLWLGHLNQNMQFYSYPQYPNTDIYAILKIPYAVILHSQMDALNQLSKNSTRTKYILKNDTKRTITEKVYYQLYQIFWNEAVCEMKVEASRERKYPPEILTTKQRVVGSLKNCVIVKLGKNVENGENIQVRIRYKQLNIDEKQETINQEEEQQSKGMKDAQEQSTHLLKQKSPKSETSKHKILIINFAFPPSAQVPNLFLYRYLQLFKFVKINPTNLQLRSMQVKNSIDIDICQYLRECSYLNKQALYSNIQNPNSVYVVWPWFGTHVCLRSNRKQVEFVYYFIGYCLSQAVWRQYMNRQKEKKNEQQYQQYPYRAQIDYLNQLCQTLYCPHDKHMQHYYEDMMEDLLPTHLDLSEGQSDDREQDTKYYQFKIKQP